MKSFIDHFLLCSLASVFLLSSSAKAQTAAVLESEQFLRSHDPLAGPLGLPNIHNAVQGEAAKTLFGSQLQAIHSLDHASDPAAVDVLIPYLGYGSDDSLVPTPYHVGYNPTLDEISKTFPAFGAILGNSAAAEELEKYALNTDHSIKYRFAAIHVLRYVNKKRFQVVVEKFGRELAQAGPMTKSRLEGIRDEDAPYDGAHPVQTDK